MNGGDPALPRGYVTVWARLGSAIFQERHARELSTILERETIYDWARTAPNATTYRGRLPAYGVALPDTRTRVVVRHATHGGLLAAFTGDRFLGSGRAPHEMDVACALLERSVPTPSVIGFARYAAGPLLSRLDVVTEEVPDARDLASAVASRPDEVQPMLEATARLLVALARAGAHHADLNLKNVLISGPPLSQTALVLDVDRVSLGMTPRDAMQGNLARLARSARKWRATGAPTLSEADLRWLSARVVELAA